MRINFALPKNCDNPALSKKKKIHYPPPIIFLQSLNLSEHACVLFPFKQDQITTFPDLPYLPFF